MEDVASPARPHAPLRGLGAALALGQSRWLGVEGAPPAGDTLSHESRWVALPPPGGGGTGGNAESRAALQALARGGRFPGPRAAG